MPLSPIEPDLGTPYVTPPLDGWYMTVRVATYIMLMVLMSVCILSCLLVASICAGIAVVFHIAAFTLYENERAAR